MAISKTTAWTSQQNVYSTWALMRNRYNLSLRFSSTANLTVTVQRRFSTGGATLDVDNFTASVEQTGIEPEDDVYYRWGIKTGNYTAGGCSGRISQ